MYYRVIVSRKKVPILSLQKKERKIDEHIWCPRGSKNSERDALYLLSEIS